jgi:hypothetical protein
MIEAMQPKPPVRLSVEGASFNAYVVGSALRVFVDGVSQDNVIAYDCEEGTVLRFVTSRFGQLVVDQAKGELKRETVRGVVTVDWVK